MQGVPAHPPPTCTYLQEAVLKVLAGVWMVLQGWGLPAVKGPYSAIYRGRGQGGLGWETLAQGTAPWGQTEKPLGTSMASPYEQLEDRMSARTGFWNEGAG